jgi:hypothetical protein
MEPVPLHLMVESYVAAKENERTKSMTANPFYTKVKFIVESSNGDLDDYPQTNKYVLEFDATDVNIWVWAEQFRSLLRLQGFAESSITELLGER